MDILRQRNSILQMARKLSQLKKQYDDLRTKLQKECKHEVLIESGYFKIISTFAPRRMCLVCVLEEDGWGTGYKNLRDNSKVNRKIVKKFEGKTGRDEFCGYRDITTWKFEDIVPASTLTNIKKPRRKIKTVSIGPFELPV